MSTYVPEPPPGLGDEIAGTVTDLIDARTEEPVDDQAGGAAPQASWPAYHLGADALRSGDALSQVVPIGWLAVVQRAGLTALADRLAARGGRLHIASEPESGTVVTASVPARAVTGFSSTVGAGTGGSVPRRAAG